MEKQTSDNKQMLYGIVGFLTGALLAVFFARNAVNSNSMDMMHMMGMRQTQQMMEERQEMMTEHEGMGIDDMVEALRGKSGDEFDEAFINLMIEHHQGAIDMANLAKVNAKHLEIKDLADDIITAQTNEIEMMREWNTTWGY